MEFDRGIRSGQVRSAVASSWRWNPATHNQKSAATATTRLGSKWWANIAVCLPLPIPILLLSLLLSLLLLLRLQVLVVDVFVVALVAVGLFLVDRLRLHADTHHTNMVDCMYVCSVCMNVVYVYHLPYLQDVVLGHAGDDPGLREVPAEVRHLGRVAAVHEQQLGRT